MEKNIYIDRSVSLWGGQNGEINIELEDGTTLTFNAYNLMQDIPTITKMVFDEVMHEKKYLQEKYKDLAEFIIK
jgi:hypothetical protein